MAKNDNAKKSKSAKSKSAPQTVDLSVRGNVNESVVIIGDNNVVNYYAAISSNIEKHEPDYWNLKHPYPMPPNFTGRVAERAMLTQWLNDATENRLFILRALGGFGKSALTWHWLTYDVNPKEWPKLVFWSFYEGDASFEHFMEDTLKYLKLEVPQGQRPQVDELLRAMQSQKILIIMDGFERALRAYSSMNAAYQGDEEPKLEDNQLDCVNLNSEIFLKSVCSLPNMKSRVLMTTRLTPRAIKPRGEFMLGCREEELTAMQKADAVEFFQKQKIKGTHAEIETACAPYGYHPLSLRLLAGRILKDFEHPADIIVAQKLKIDGDIVQQKHRVLEVSYNSLPLHEQKLLSTIACFRSPVELKTLESIDVRVDDRPPLQDDLHDLVDRGLLHFDEKNKKFDLHPILRRYAYERLTTTERTGTHTRLRNYFAVVDVPEKPQTLEDLAPIIELYHHTVRADGLDRAAQIFESRLAHPLYYQFGAYQTIIDLMQALFLSGEDKPPYLKDEAWQAWALNTMAGAYALSGQPRLAEPLKKLCNTLYKNGINNPGSYSIIEWKINLATVMSNLATTQQVIGALYVSESNLRSSIDLCREIQDEFQEAIDHQQLGQLLIDCGVWNEAEKELDLAERVIDEYGAGQTNYLSVVRASRALGALLMARDPAQSKIKKLKSAIQFAQRAIELALERAQVAYPVERDFVLAYWLLGAAYLFDGQLELAEHHLSDEALPRCRAINLIESEANILLDIARLRYDQKNYEEAKSLADEALTITERCGYVLQGADVNLFLAQYALDREKDKVKAKEYAESALKLAYCDGPPYYYKVAYDEAERMLESLNKK